MDEDEFDELTDEEDRMTAVSMHGDPGSHSAFRAIVMVFALSLHSIFEGIAIGLRPTTQQVCFICSYFIHYYYIFRCSYACVH